MTEEQTVKKNAIIQSSAGLHVRPARKLSTRASEFDATISIRKVDVPEEEAVDAKSIMELLTLGAGKGTELIVSASGEDADQAAEVISNMIEDGSESDV